MIRFLCPSCGLALGAPERAAGKKGPCPSCGQRLQVPVPERKRTMLGRLLYGEDRPRLLPASEPPPEAYPPPMPVLPAVPVAEVDHDYGDDLTERRAPVVHVHTAPRNGSSGAAHSLGISSLVIAFLAFPFCWLPLIGLFFAGVGLLLGIMGVFASAARDGSGIGFALAGSAVNLVALLMAVYWLGLFVGF